MNKLWKTHEIPKFQGFPSISGVLPEKPEPAKKSLCTGHFRQGLMAIFQPPAILF